MPLLKGIILAGLLVQANPTAEDRLSLDLNICMSIQEGLKTNILHLQAENRTLQKKLEEVLKKCGDACK